MSLRRYVKARDTEFYMRTGIILVCVFILMMIIWWRIT